ncbi:hypothetical protein [Neobacillus drentensis]|uniref:hypothetical protein n=1 Tax=Neobacillus drentensis TaxID=220684 RepID=UPI002860AA8A|nr:hypothetical protein [Neobacillus drentensis]MDR7240844.1 putative membrane protein [Neobacillus drentensis]
MKLKYKGLIGGIFGGIVAFVMLTVSKFSTNYFINHININITPKDMSLLTLLFFAHIALGAIFIGAAVLIWERFFQRKYKKE